MTRIKKYEEALDYIAGVILPVYTKDDEKYVKLEVAINLRDTAREALGRKKDAI